jgi:26S proteasome regulatory subunit T4
MASSSNPSAEPIPNDPKAQALTAYRKRLLEHRELDAQLKDGKKSHLSNRCTHPSFYL